MKVKIICITNLDVERTFIDVLQKIDENDKKIIVKLSGKKQHTINVQSLMKQGLDPEEIEEVISRKLHELDPLITSFEFVLNVESIAETVQPETDKLLRQL